MLKLPLFIEHSTFVFFNKKYHVNNLFLKKPIFEILLFLQDATFDISVYSARLNIKNLKFLRFTCLCCKDIGFS